MQPVDDVVQLLLYANSPLLPDSLLKHHSTLSSNALTSSTSGSAASSVDDIAQMLLDKAKASTLACDLFETRLDLYAEASERGSSEALYFWAMMIRYGYESSASGASCGYEKTTPLNAEQESDQERALLALVIAADMGYAPALVPIAVSVLTGLGLDAVLHPVDGKYSVPVSRDYTIAKDNKASKGRRSDVVSSGSNLLDNIKKGSAEGSGISYRVTALQQHLSEYLTESTVWCQWNQDNNNQGDNEGKVIILIEWVFMSNYSFRHRC